jgi:hypothetical protein
MIYFLNIHTSSGNIKFICESFRNRKKREHIWQAFHSCFQARTNKFYISGQCVYCVYTAMPCMQKIVNLHTKQCKETKTLDSLVEFGVYSIRSAFNHFLLRYTLHKMKGTRKLYMSRRCI